MYMYDLYNNKLFIQVKLLAYDNTAELFRRQVMVKSSMVSCHINLLTSLSQLSHMFTK